MPSHIKYIRIDPISTYAFILSHRQLNILHNYFPFFVVQPRPYFQLFQGVWCVVLSHIVFPFVVQPRPCFHCCFKGARCEVLSISILFLSTDPVVKLSILFLAMGQFVWSFFLTCFYICLLLDYSIGMFFLSVFFYLVQFSFLESILIVIWMLKVLNHEMERLLVFG